MSRKKKKPAHAPYEPWDREKIQAFLTYYGTPAEAAAGAGVARQAFHEAMVRYGVETPETPPADPTKQRANAGRKNPLVTVALRPEHHAWLAAQGKGRRSTLAQKGLDYLSAPDRAAWLAQNEDADTLDRAAAMARGRA